MDAGGAAIPGTQRRPSPRQAKRKGREAENAVVTALRAAGYPVERRRLAGSADRGDVANLPGVVVEIKSVAKMALPSWLREAETERVNDGAHVGVVWHKLRGHSDAMDWCVSMTPRTFLRLLAALYGEQ